MIAVAVVGDSVDGVDGVDGVDDVDRVDGGVGIAAGCAAPYAASGTPAPLASQRPPLDSNGARRLLQCRSLEQQPT